MTKFIFNRGFVKRRDIIGNGIARHEVILANAATYTIAHNLGREPIILIEDSTGEEIQSGVEIIHESLNQFVVNFTPNITGKVIYY